jgi:hypothetical protein
VGLRFKTPDYGMLAYYFQAGLFPGVLVGGRMYGIDNVKHSISKDSNAMICGTQIGLGCMYAMGEGTYLQGGLSLDYCFTDALSAGNIKAMPIGIGLHFGFLF